MKKYIEIVNLPMPCVFILKGGTRFDLRTGIPKNAYDVWKTGFKNLGLLPDAVELLKKEKVSDLFRLIEQSKRNSDIEIIASVKPENEKLQLAAQEKIKSLTN